MQVTIKQVKARKQTVVLEMDIVQAQTMLYRLAQSMQIDIDRNVKASRPTVAEGYRKERDKFIEQAEYLETFENTAK